MDLKTASALVSPIIAIGAVVYSVGAKDAGTAAELQGLVPAVEELGEQLEVVGAQLAEHLAERKAEDMAIQKRLSKTQAIACEAAHIPMTECPL